VGNCASEVRRKRGDGGKKKNFVEKIWNNLESIPNLKTGREGKEKGVVQRSGKKKRPDVKKGLGKSKRKSEPRKEYLEGSVEHTVGRGVGSDEKVMKELWGGGNRGRREGV